MTLRTTCHPEASGRSPKVGEMQYDVFLPLESGEVLHILMGVEGHTILRDLFIQEYADETVEKLLSDG